MVSVRRENCNTTPLSGHGDHDFTLVSIIVPSILEEGFVVLIAHRNLVEPGEDVTDLTQEVGIQGFRRRRSSPGLELAVEEVMHVDCCLVVADMSKALTE